MTAAEAGRIAVERLTDEAFRPFGDLLRIGGEPDRWINAGLCGRWHDLARLDFGEDGRAGISLFRSEARRLPHAVDMVERHPDGSQAFLPMTPDPFLVVVAPDEGGRPGRPRAFLTEAGDGVNVRRGTWHGVLTPLVGGQVFAVVDRIGEGPNLEEWRFEAPWVVERPRVDKT